MSFSRNRARASLTALLAICASGSTAAPALAATHAAPHGARGATQLVKAVRCESKRTKVLRVACRTHTPVAHMATLGRWHVTVALTSAPSASGPATTARFTWSTTGPVRQTACSLNGAPATLCSSGVSYTGLATGKHTFEVMVAGGNTARASDSWTVTAAAAAPVTTTTTVAAPPVTTTTTTVAAPPVTTTSTTTTTPVAPAPAPAGNSTGANTTADIFGIATGSTLQNEDGTPQLAQDLNLDQSAGAGWIRIDINWAQIQVGGPNSYNWANIDDAVEAAEARGMHVLGTIVYTPNWSRPAGTDGTYVANPAQYAAFAATAAQHYAQLGVSDFEIWNEPNQIGSWTPAPNVAAYTTLLKDSYTAIKAVDPSATVITGGLSPAASDGTNISPTDFLAGIYANGGKGYFDAVGMHPYCNPDLPGQPDAWSAWYQMYGTPVSLRSIMIANGDSNLKIWGTEFGAPTSGATGLSQAFQSQTVTDAYQLWSTYSWAGPLFFYEGRDNGTDATNTYDNYGFATTNFTLKQSFYAYQEAATAL